MSLDAIKAIKEIEEQGENIRREAQEKAREIIQQANASASDYQASMNRQMQAEGEALLKKARQEAEEAIKALEQENAAACQAIRDKAEERLEEAISLIMGRIVKSHGNS